jgi:hypothetical protein
LTTFLVDNHLPLTTNNPTCPYNAEPGLPEDSNTNADSPADLHHAIAAQPVNHLIKKKPAADAQTAMGSAPPWLSALSQTKASATVSHFSDSSDGRAALALNGGVNHENTQPGDKPLLHSDTGPVKGVPLFSHSFLLICL